LDDGAIELQVISVEKGKINCVALNKGTLGNKKGVNIPGESVLLPAMSEKDKLDILWGVKNDIDFIAASFTRKASDIKEIRNYVASLMSKYHPPSHPHPLIISKIESTEALANFDSILEETDAIMVARGDLGVEVPMETLTNLQKEIVRKSNLAGKPVIVATQMLESMQKNPRPTRAECTDVTNAVFDGADCVMLSGESAKGKYPYQSVNMMKRIVDQAEAWVNNNRELSPAVVVKPRKDDNLESVSHAAVEISKNLNAACIIVISKDGSLATIISKFRPLVPILAFVSNEKIGRLLQIHRGVYPIVDDSVIDPSRKTFSNVVEKAQSLGYCGKHQNVVIISAERSSYDLAYHTTVDVVSTI
jgi:pyruvate kinase